MVWEATRRLDVIFKKDSIDSAHEAYKTFDAYCQSEPIPISDYIAKFELLMVMHHVKLPDLFWH